MNGPGRAPDVDARPSPTPPPNGKPAAKQLNVHREPKKSLFAHHANKENSTKSGSRHAHCKLSPTVAPPRRPASSSSARPSSAMSAASDRSVSTTPKGGTRLPRANTTGRPSSRDQGRFTLFDAARIAGQQLDEEDRQRLGSPGGVNASPSPAPRTWRRNNSDDANARGTQGRGAKSRNSMPSGIPRRPGSSASQSSPSTSGSSAGRRISDFAKKTPAGNLFGNSKISPKVAKTGEVLARKASNSSLDGHGASPGPNKGAKSKTAPGWAKPPGKENDLPGVGPAKTEADVPIPSVEPNQEQRLSSSWEVLEGATPNKSYAWQVDDEFTAGDLQISDSPRIRFDTDMNKPMRPLNTKLDEIMEREAEDINEYPLPEGTRHRTFDTRLPEIEELENQLDDYAKSNQDRPRNTKIDDIRALEMEVLSKKALATSRLDEIRALNSQSRPRSASPVPYQPSSEFARDSTRYYDAESSSDNGDWVEGERIPHTPVTVFRKARDERPRDSMMLRASSDTEDYGASNTDARDRGQDVLRRLARASSASPEMDATNRRSDGRNHDTNPKLAAAAPIITSKPSNSPPSKEESQRSSPSKTGKNSKAGNPKPSVGFVGLRRVASSESTRTKRSSMAQSDGDPTERIEREMLLFAPADNQSDRGSIRVPTPDIDDEEEEEEKKAKGGEEKEKSSGPEAGDLEETPRPKRQQSILSMPTPKVSGAYVETPATVKAEAPSEEPVKAPAVSIAVPDKPDMARRRRSYSTSDKGESDRESSQKTRATRSHRRTRSVPKHRQPLLNTAKPPTVRDDLMELQKTHNIEDSTLDDFGELLSSKDVPDSPEIDEMLEDMTDQILEEVARKQDKRKNGEAVGDIDRDPEMDAIARMTKSLQTGLLSIRSAKQGIERLEDRVSHADPELLKRAKEKVERKMRKKIKKEENEEGTEQVSEEKAETPAPVVKQHVEEKTDDPTPVVKRRVRQGKTDEPAPVVKEEVKEKKAAKPLLDTKPERPVSKGVKSTARDAALAYISIPLPCVYRRSPFRLTFLGLLVIATALWCAAESVVCGQYCRPTTCTTGPCVWSLDDPTFGYAIPHKVDDWTTGGQGRLLTTRLSEELSDISADALDFIRGTDIRDVNVEDLGFEDRRKYRRRLKKKGLATERVEPAEHRGKWDSWRTDRTARERVSAAREMGYYDYEESESMNDDVMV